jgi:uncharacterized damage-inducible protein DinB
VDKKDIIDLFEYHVWAKERLIASLKQMKQEDFERDLHSSHGGIRGTLFHIINAENLWLGRLAGEVAQPIDGSNLNGLSQLQDEWDGISKKMSALISRFSDEELHAQFSYRDTRGNVHYGPRIWAFQQLFNHFSYHRGQIVTMQRQLGYTPANTDIIGFLRERRA